MRQISQGIQGYLFGKVFMDIGNHLPHEAVGTAGKLRLPDHGCEQQLKEILYNVRICFFSFSFCVNHFKELPQHTILFVQQDRQWCQK